MSAIACVLVVLLLLFLPAGLMDMATTMPEEVPPDVLEAIAPGISAAPPSSAKWLCPLPIGTFSITSEYGWREHPINGVQSFHNGIDLGAAQYTPVYATRAGTVTTIAYNNSAGNHIILNHGDGFDSRYLHLAYCIVSSGQTVQQGQVIGYVGSTGESTGPHLDFRIHYNGKSEDPTAYVNFTGETSDSPEKPKPPVQSGGRYPVEIGGEST